MKNSAVYGAALLVLLAAGLACSLVGSGGPPDDATPGTVIISGAGTGGCVNPLFPVRPGALWFYSVTGGPKGNYTYSTSVLNTSGSGFTQDAIFSDIRRSISWECTPDGLAVLSPGGGAAASLVTDSTFANFVTTGHSGVTLPASVATGQQWSQSLQLNGTQTLPDGSEATSTGTYTISFEAGDSQNVTVSAGPFNARRVQWAIDLNFSVTVSGVTEPVHFGLTGIDWYAPGVGLIKQVVEGDQEYTVELTSYVVP